MTKSVFIWWNHGWSWTFLCCQILYLNSVMFELEVVRPCMRPMTNKEEDPGPGPRVGALQLLTRRGSQGQRTILLKGQMRYFSEVNSVIFLCNPVWVSNSFVVVFGSFLIFTISWFFFFFNNYVVLPLFKKGMIHK